MEGVNSQLIAPVAISRARIIQVMIISACTSGLLLHLETHGMVRFSSWSLGSTKTLLFCFNYSSIAACLTAATGTSTPLLIESLVLLCAVVCSCFHFFPHCQDLLFLWTCEPGVAHSSTNVTAPIVPSAATSLYLFAFHAVKCPLYWIHLGVKHGIQQKEVLHHDIEKQCMLTHQCFNQSFWCFWVALKFELICVTTECVAYWDIGFQLVSNHFETCINGGNTITSIHW